MSQQILIIGLGHFGMSLARTLSEKGAEVLGVDVNKNLVEEAAAFVTEAVVIDATDEGELAQLEPGKRDLAVCAIGDDSKEASIICTALLRQMGTPRRNSTSKRQDASANITFGRCPSSRQSGTGIRQTVRQPPSLQACHCRYQSRGRFTPHGDFHSTIHDWKKPY